MVAVSVLIPVYNAEKYLEECLESIVNQTLNSMEVIVLDDGSTDKSSQIIDEYAEKYSFVCAVHRENKGVVKTRCDLMNLAKGEYVAWIDSDDFMELDMLEKMYMKAKESDADLVLCDYSYFPAAIKTKEKWYKPYKGVSDWNFIERNTQQWNKLVKRSLLEELKISEWMAKSGEGIYALVLIKAAKIVSIDSELYHYRVGHTSLSNNKQNVKWYLGNVEKTKEQWEAAKSFLLLEDQLKYFEYRYIYSILQAMIVSAFNNDETSYRNMKQKLMTLDWKKNPYTKMILRNNHGEAKAFVFVNVVPNSFTFTKAIARVAMK